MNSIVTAPVILELCCESAAEAVRAVRCGAARIELCADLAAQGLTPARDLVASTRALVAVPLVALIRPRAGDFHYSPGELAAMLREVEAALEAGADSIAVGALTDRGDVDARAVGALQRAAGAAAVAFHRAFDAARDPFEALDALADLGVARILTSGGAPTALEGASRIRALVERAAGRIGIVACGRIRTDTLAEVVRRTGVTEVHRRFAPDLLSTVA
jgi:copper homeostasis protein